MKNIYIIGVGLIGGSIAKDIKKLHSEINIHGIDNNEDHLDEALSLGIIDRKANLNELNKADIVIVAIPVDATVNLLPRILDLVSDDALVMESGSTKEAICKVVQEGL